MNETLRTFTTLDEIEQELEKEQQAREQRFDSIVPGLGRVLGPGMMILAGGGTGSGKSYIGLSEAINAIKHGYKVAYYHNEMTTGQLLQRIEDMDASELILSKLYLCTVDDYSDPETLIKNATDFECNFIIFDHIAASNLNFSNCTSSVDRLEEFCRRLNDCNIKYPQVCIYVFSQVNGRVRLNEPIDQAMDKLDYADDHGLLERFPVGYLFCKTGVTRDIPNNNFTCTNCSQIYLDIRKNRFELIKERYRELWFDYQKGEFKDEKGKV